MIMFHLWARSVVSEKIVFEERVTTAHHIEGAVLNKQPKPEPDWLLEIGREVVGPGRNPLSLPPAPMTISTWKSSRTTGGMASELSLCRN